MVLFVLSSANFAVAQDNIVQNDPSEVIIVLNNGSRLEGRILHLEPENYIEIESTWGQTLRFYKNQYKRVIQKSAAAVKGIREEYNFKEQGWYAALRGQWIGGNDGSRAHHVSGIGFSVSGGHRIHRLLAIGGGIGYDQYVWDSGEDLIPVFAEISGYLMPSHTSLFYNIQSGYSFASPDERYLLQEAKGGWMFYPSVGIRFGTDDLKYSLDFGYKFQHAEYTYRNAWEAERTHTQDVLYKRLCLRFGILLQ